MTRALSLMVAGALCGLLTCAPTGAARACDTALVLAIDVSGSISMNEYTLQMQGLADALADPAVVQAIVQGQDALAILHWSGANRQVVALDWQTPASAGEVAALAQVIRGIERPDTYTSTAIGQGITAALALLAKAPPCGARVIDVSGDGKENDGMTLPQARAAAVAAGVAVNGVAIEVSNGTNALTDYYLQNVVSPDGFVITARGLKDYPRAIHQKLLRELTRPVS